MAESDPPVNQDDYSPSLGGERASASEAPGEAEAGQSAGGASFTDFADLFGAETQAELEGLVERFGLFGQTLQSLVTETVQVFETRLPETLAAFEGLLDAVSQAFEEGEARPRAEETPVAERDEATEVQDQDV